jgi:hypothetical protein
VRLIVGLYHRDLPRVGEIGVSMNVLLFTFAISLLIAVVLGFVPVLHASRRQLQSDLQDGGRGSSGSHTRARNVLIVAQVALTLMLLIGAGLLGRSFQRLLAVDPGFRAESVVAMTVLLPQPEEPAAMRSLAQFYHELFERIGALPGVTNVGGTSALPMSGNGANGTFMEVRNGTVPETMQEFVRQLVADRFPQLSPVIVRTDEHKPVEPLSFGADDKLHAFCWHRAELTDFGHPVFHQGRSEGVYCLVRVNVSLPSGRKRIEDAALLAVMQVGARGRQGDIVGDALLFLEVAPREGASGMPEFHWQQEGWTFGGLGENHQAVKSPPLSTSRTAKRPFSQT